MIYCKDSDIKICSFNDTHMYTKKRCICVFNLSIYAEKMYLKTDSQLFFVLGYANSRLLFLYFISNHVRERERPELSAKSSYTGYFTN